MLSKNTITDICQLHQKKYREERESFMVEGEKSVFELLRSAWKTELVYCEENWFAEHSQEFSHKTKTIVITRKEMERISSLKTPQPVLAIAYLPKFSTADIVNNEPLLALDSIRDPGNLGTIIRTADWFGMKQILCSPDTVEFSNPKTIQASMGSFTRVKLIYHDLPSYIESLNGKRTIIGTFTDGESIKGMKIEKNAIVVIGNEAQGISEKLNPFITKKITIPSGGERETESLNASVATAIILYQWNNEL